MDGKKRRYILAFPNQQEMEEWQTLIEQLISRQQNKAKRQSDVKAAEQHEVFTPFPSTLKDIYATQHITSSYTARNAIELVCFSLLWCDAMIVCVRTVGVKAGDPPKTGGPAEGLEAGLRRHLRRRLPRFVLP